MRASPPSQRGIRDTQRNAHLRAAGALVQALEGCIGKAQA